MKQYKIRVSQEILENRKQVDQNIPEIEGVTKGRDNRKMQRRHILHHNIRGLRYPKRKLLHAAWTWDGQGCRHFKHSRVIRDVK